MLEGSEAIEKEDGRNRKRGRRGECRGSEGEYAGEGKGNGKREEEKNVGEAKGVCWRGKRPWEGGWKESVERGGGGEEE